VNTFGISTHLFHGERLARRHLERVKAQGFDVVELFATRTHVDYHDDEAVAALRTWLDELGMRATSLHLPICDGYRHGVWGRTYSNATPDPTARAEAIDETRAAAAAAGRLGCDVAVLHLGIPRGQPIPPDDNDRGALARSLEPIARASAEAGVRLALEVIPNDLATPDALLEWLSADLDLGDTAVCLDFGHAHLVGGAPEAFEALGGHIVATHVHDNAGVSDDHLVPFQGTINWTATLTAMLKVGYLGPLIFELPGHGDADRVLAGAVDARRRIQSILEDLARPIAFD
jgi:sugar phosphate isomerase/epimerase